jgi:hypothetical protein
MANETLNTTENRMMRHWNNVLLSTSVVLVLVMLACTPAADVGGTWEGSMNGQNAGKAATTNLHADLQQSSHGIAGTLTWHNSTGAWGLMEGNVLAVRSGSVSGNKVSFIAEKNLPGGTVTVNFKGNVEGTTMKGTADVNIGSVMGGDTYLGNLELTRK